MNPKFASIKSQKLRLLMEKSQMFNALPQDEQEKKIKSIASLPLEKQDTAIYGFFMESSLKEQEDTKRRSQVLKTILEKIKEMDRAIRKLERKELEGMEEKKEGATEKTLIDQLNDV